jgi:hypothetical protein
MAIFSPFSFLLLPLSLTLFSLYIPILVQNGGGGDEGGGGAPRSLIPETTS